MTDTVPLGLSIVGAGYWGPNLVRNFSLSPLWKLVSVVDRDAVRLAKLARQFPGVERENDFGTVLKDERVVAVAIATPVETHYQLVKDALLAGKHVLVEKPITQTAVQAEEIIALARQRGLTVMVDHTFLYTGSVELLRQMVERQAFGKIFYIDSVRVNLGLFQTNANVIYDLAPHDISIINYILGEYPLSVAAQVGNCIHDDLADVAFITLRYPSGVLAHAHLSWLSPVKLRRLTIAGQMKMAQWDDVEPTEKVRIYDKGVETSPSYESSAQRMVSYRTGDMHAPALDTTEALAKVVKSFHEAIVSKRTPRSTAEDGLAVVRVLEASDRSIAEGGAVITIH